MDNAIGVTVGIAGGLAGIIIAGLVAWLILRSLRYLFRVIVPMLIFVIRQKVREVVPDAPQPTLSVALCIIAVGLTALVALDPSAGIWNAIMKDARGAEPSAKMLGAAAALLALLTFVGNQARTIETAAREGVLYFGIPLHAYRFRRSIWVRVTHTTEFRLLLASLFAVPLLLPVVPDDFPGQPKGARFGESLSMVDILGALWCASFAIVATVLIMIATASLRLSLIEVTRPDHVRRLVTYDLSDEIADDWARLLRHELRQDGGARHPGSWLRAHLRQATQLPTAEQEPYIRTVLGAASTATLHEAVIKHDSKAQRAEVSSDIKTLDVPTPTVLHDVQVWWQLSRPRHLAARGVQVLAATYRGIAFQCLEHLLSPGVRTGPDMTDVRELLIGYLLGRADEVDGLHYNLGNGDLARVLLNPSNDLPAVGQNLLPRRFGEADGPPVLVVPAVIYRELSRAMFRPGMNEQRLISSREGFRNLVDRARLIRHSDTRTFALREIIDAYTQGVVAVGDVTDDTSPLEDLHRSLVSAAPEQHEIPPTSIEICTEIERSAFHALLSVDAAQEHGMKHLLAVLPRSDRIVALLYRQFYARRSYDAVDVSTLRVFHAAKRSTWHAAELNFEALTKRAVRVLCGRGSRTGHFTTPEGVSWLIGTLEGRLAAQTCREFVDRKTRREITELQLVDFIGWHAAVGHGFTDSRCNPHPQEEATFSDDLHTDDMDHVKKLHDDWQEVDRDTAFELEGMLDELCDS